MEHFNSLSEDEREITNKVKIHVGRLCYVDKDKDNVQYMQNELTGWSYFPYSVVQTGLEHIKGFFIANGVSPFFKINYNEPKIIPNEEQAQPKDLYTFKPLQEDVPIRLSDARFWTYKSVEDKIGAYEKHKMKLTVEDETGNLQIDCIPTRDSTALVKNNILKLKDKDKIYEGKILKVEYKKQTELETETFGYYEHVTKDVWTFVLDNPEWDETLEQWNGQQLFVTNPTWTELEEALNHNGFTKDEHGFYFKYTQVENADAQLETVLKEIPNPDLPGNNTK